MSATYFARRVTLPAVNTVYRLSALIVAVTPSAPVTGAINLAYTNDQAGIVERGDASMTALGQGLPLGVGDSDLVSGGMWADAADIYVITDTAGAKLFVEIRQG